MKLKYLLMFFVLVSFSGCEEGIQKSLNEEEASSVSTEAVQIPAGIYKTGCIVNGASSAITYLEISEDQLEKTVQVEIYANDNICDVLTDDGTGSIETREIEFAQLNFGNETSYMIEGGGTKYTPYHLEGADLYMGESENVVSYETAFSLFENFIADPVGAPSLKFTLQVF